MNAALILAGQTVQIPSEGKLFFGKPLGIVEVLIVASTAPFVQCVSSSKLFC